MNQEGYYQTKPACYSSEFISPDDPSCLGGSPWVSSIAVNMMADDKNFKNKNVKLVNHDEFHRATTVVPVHHPYIEGKCSLSETKECTIVHYSVTENAYYSVNDFDKLQKFQVAAYEMKTKIKSRQALRIASGETDADFDKYDKTGQRCAEINQAAVDWAVKHSDPKTVERYKSKGELAV
jgi:hypothetical protein